VGRSFIVFMSSPTKAEDLIHNSKYDSANLCQRKSATRPEEQLLTQTL